MLGAVAPGIAATIGHPKHEHGSIGDLALLRSCAPCSSFIGSGHTASARAEGMVSGTRSEGAWESNPPGRLVTPHSGFEDRTRRSVSARYRLELPAQQRVQHRCRPLSTALLAQSRGLPTVEVVWTFQADSLVWIVCHS